MLQNMCNERLISAVDEASFETTLAVHQRAVGADGATIFCRAVVEHNVLAAARIYKNCTFASLGALLGVDPVKVSGKRGAPSASKLLTTLVLSSHAGGAHRCAHGAREAARRVH